MGRIKITYRAEKSEKPGRVVKKALGYANLSGKKVEIEFCPTKNFPTSPEPNAKLVVCPQWDVQRAMQEYKKRFARLRG